MTPLEVLGLPEGSSADEISARWRALRSELHPDHGGDAERFHAASRAYDEALREAGEPKPCPTCGGAGTIKVARGFNVIGMSCNACDGTGEFK